MSVDNIAEKIIDTNSSPKERRSAERLEDDRRLRIHEAWLESLDDRVLKGILTPKERRRKIALADLRRDKKYLREKDKNKIDPLSGLGRQEHLRPKLNEMIAKGMPFAVLFTDLDNFSQFNEKYGHPAGDEIIAQSGFRIYEGLRRETPERVADEAFIGNPYRNGGDETAIVLPGVNTINQLTHVGNRIRVLINETPFTIPLTNEKVNLTASIGGIIWDGKQSSDDFLKTVDQYLYKAKEVRGSLAV